MNLFNPLMRQNGFPLNNFSQQNSNIPQFDPIKFQQGVQSLDQNTLIQLAQRARAQGIPESQIEAGLNYILSLK